MMAREIKSWSIHDKARLSLFAITNPKNPAAEFARKTGRSPASVRTMLCRLRKDALLRPPTLSTASTDAAAPRVPTARGPSDTPDTD